MTYEGDNPNDPTGEMHESEPLFHSADGEIMPRTQHEGIDVPVPAPLPVPIDPRVSKPPILVQRRTLSTLLLVIVVLLLVVGALLYGTLKQGTKTVAVSATASASASPTPTPTAPTDSTGADSSSPTPVGVGTPTATDGSFDTSSATSTGVAGIPGGSFSPAFGTQFLGAPVDGSVDTQVDVHISNADYPQSVQFYCPTSGLLDWNVAGYLVFSATFGIPDDARSATGITNIITFADQNGRSLDVVRTSIGQPAKVQFNVNGAERLIVSCARQGSNDSVNNLIALGNAQVSTS